MIGEQGTIGRNSVAQNGEKWVYFAGSLQKTGIGIASCKWYGQVRAVMHSATVPVPGQTEGGKVVKIAISRNVLRSHDTPKFFYVL